MRIKKKRILIVFGTRPEAIKMAPLVQEFRKYPEQFHTMVCVTGQHRQMLDQVLHLFEIEPEYDLDIMREGQDLFDITTKVITGMKKVLGKSKPDIVFVHGDTLTSTAASLAAFFYKIPVAHVEAGLRTNNPYSPWPEEINRQITGRLATYHFAPTESARKNLLKENIDSSKVFVTGNTVIDALFSILKKINTSPGFAHELQLHLKKNGYDIARLNTGRKLVLITGHRRENFGKGFINICAAIGSLTASNPDVDFVYPVHLNPNVQKQVFGLLGNLESRGNVFLISPLEYLPFLYLMKQSYLVLTDSGGIQEEAPSLGKPVLVMRDFTERTEAVEAGTVQLVGTNSLKIEKAVNNLLNNNQKYQVMSQAINPYGDGNSASRIVSIVSKFKA
jgi:UDP-N-acetylglucosamine 2-epimerase (non-hydrolysing)